MKARVLSGHPRSVNESLPEYLENGWRVTHMHSYGLSHVTEHSSSVSHVVTLVIEKEEDD